MHTPKTQRIAAWIEARKYLLLILFTAIYLPCAIGRAGGRPFWYDEVITLIAAKAPDLATAWKAAMATDANPPLPHLLTHLSIRWFGLNEVTARLPAIAGFWLLCLSLYVFVARRKGAVYGLCALLMPTMTGAYYYAAEARAYGPELGFCGLALVAWQTAAEGRHRAVALCTLALSMSAMLLCHYYAVLVYLPFAGAELIRVRRTRRADWGVWIALALGGVPMVWRAATIVGVVKSFAHTWAPAYLRQGLEFWESQLAPGAAFAALLLGLLALVARRETPEETDEVPEHEWVASGAPGGDSAGWGDRRAVGDAHVQRSLGAPRAGGLLPARADVGRAVLWQARCGRSGDARRAGVGDDGPLAGLSVARQPVRC